MLIVHLFVSYAHVSLCHFLSSSWCRGFAAASACSSSWTFLFWILFFYFVDPPYFWGKIYQFYMYFGEKITFI